MQLSAELRFAFNLGADSPPQYSLNDQFAFSASHGKIPACHPSFRVHGWKN